MHRTLPRFAVIASIGLLLALVGAAPALAIEAGTITGQASPTSSTAGTTLTVADTATVTGTSVVPTGTVDFAFFDNDTCTGTPVLAGTGSALAATTGFSATSTFSMSWTAIEGTYFWRATYAGDTNVSGSSTACNDVAQQVVVAAAPPPAKATPTLAGVATPSDVVAGQEITLSDTATLTGARTPTGVIAFALFDNPNCDGDTVLDGVAPIVGDAANFDITVTPTEAGEYFWTAFYPGDVNNEATDSPCDDAAQALRVAQATEPVIAETGAPGGAAGGGTPELPATGPAPVGPLSLAGLALVLLGVVLVRFGRLPQIAAAQQALNPHLSEASARLAASLQRLSQQLGPNVGA